MSEATIVALILGDRNAASSRIRAHEPLDRLEERGVSVSRIIASGRLWPLLLLGKIVKYRPEVTYIQKVLPPRWFLGLIRLFSIHLVFDLDDAVYLGYPGETKKEAKRSMRRTRLMLKFCDRFITSSLLIARDLRMEEDDRFRLFPGPAPSSVTNTDGLHKEDLVLWLGSPSTYMNVENMLPNLLLSLPTQKFLVVGTPVDFEFSERCKLSVWTTDREIVALRRCRIGIMPLADTPWNSRKAGYKLLEYMAAGVVPVMEKSLLVETLLGNELELVCELVRESNDQGWSDAIVRAHQRQIDRIWLEARDRVFARWSQYSYANLLFEGEI